MDKEESVRMSLLESILECRSSVTPTKINTFIFPIVRKLTED
jgi:hypothetical protein